MKVRDIMTCVVYTCLPQDTLDAAAEIMREVDCGCVPVVEAANGRVLGMITDRDICLAAFLSGLPLRALRIDSVMEGAVQTCIPEDDVTKAADVMRHARIRRLPVVNGGGEIVGILSLNDMARATKRAGNPNGVRPEEVVGILASISVPRGAEEPGSRAPRQRGVTVRPG